MRLRTCNGYYTVLANFFKCGLLFLFKLLGCVCSLPYDIIFNERSGSLKKFIEEFKTFALKGNMIDMAIGIVIGTAFSGIVTSLTDNLINPILNVVTGGAHYNWNDIAGFISAFLTALINFLIMAFVLFCIVKAVNKLKSLGPKKEESVIVKKCPYCQSEIDIKAVKCPHCTSLLDGDDSGDDI